MFGEIATAFETRQTEGFEQQAFTALQSEYPKHFEALKQHPRTLVGQEVPSTTGPGMERLRDSEDAKDWQDAMRALLVSEAESRVEASRDGAREVFSTVHSSIALFQNNTDLIPGTKQFDRELADAFATAVSDYQVRADGKLVGYSVPVQPIINAIRQQLAGRRAAAPSAPAAAALATAQQQRAAEQARTEAGRFTGPQAGIRSQAGQSAPEGTDDAAGLLGAFARQNGFVI